MLHHDILVKELLFNGSNISTKTNRLIIYAVSDAIFAIAYGEVKPAKQLLMGMALKSMMRSKKLIESGR